METNICIAGFGGQGVMTIGKFLAQAVCDATELNTVFFPTYGAEQRGGTANCFVVISDKKIGTPKADQMDDLIILNNPSLAKFAGTLKPGGNLFINDTIVTDEICGTIFRSSASPARRSPWSWAIPKSSTSSCWALTSVIPGGLPRGRHVAHHRG